MNNDDSHTRDTSPKPDNYTYPNSNTLKNKYGLTDMAQFEQKAAHDTTKEIINLRLELLPENLDSSYLKYIHKRLFRNTFEWAGHTRNVPFIFSDGSSASMSEMVRSDARHICFASANEITQGLKNVDKILLDGDNFRGLSRREFVNEASGLFAAVNYLHPFREGNGRTQRMFFETLAKIAGHELDFSLVTKKRMTDVCIAAMGQMNPMPMRRMFEDISHPQKRAILKEFLDIAKERGIDVDNRYVIVAEEGMSIMGTFVTSGDKGFTVDTGNAFVICMKEDAIAENLDNVQVGEYVSFTAANAPEILIPEKKMGPLPHKKLLQGVSQDPYIQENLSKIRELSKIVYGNPEILNEEMEKIQRNPTLAKNLAQQIKNDPESIAGLAGKRLLLLKDSTRRNAEYNVVVLIAAVENHANISGYVQEKIIHDYQKEAERKENCVEVPDKNLWKLLSLSGEQRKELLLRNPDLKKELNQYTQKISTRLSPEEHKAVDRNDSAEFARTVGISVEKAQKAIEVVKLVKEVHAQAQKLGLEQSKHMALVS